MIRISQKEELPAVVDLWSGCLEREAAKGSVKACSLPPVMKTAEEYCEKGLLYVGTEGREIFGAVILRPLLPEDYSKVDWSSGTDPEKILVMSFFCLKPEWETQKHIQEFIRFVRSYAMSHGFRKVLNLF